MASADPMRDRLRQLRRAESREVAPELEARIVDRLRTQGPVIVRRSRQRRAWLRASAIALPLGLCAAGLIWSKLVSSGVEVVAHRSGAAAKPNLGGSERDRSADAPRAVAPAVVASTADCAGRARPETTFSALPGGRRWIDLGGEGRIVLEPGSDAQLDAANPCALELRLTEGRVSVHAANLHGGELRVRAGSTDVVVHGTKFAVARAREAVTVQVDEGAVAVEQHGRADVPLLRGGQQLSIDAVRAPVLLALSAESRQQLRAALAAVPVASAPEANAGPMPPVAAARGGTQAASEGAIATRDAIGATLPESRARSSSPGAKAQAAKLVAAADAAWRSGDRDAARALYRQAGNQAGATAEAAWLTLARRELSAGRAVAARDAIATYRARFPNGDLAAEAAGIEFRTAIAAHNAARAEVLARRLVDGYAGTPQAAAAASWLRDTGARR